MITTITTEIEIREIVVSPSPSSSNPAPSSSPKLQPSWTQVTMPNEAIAGPPITVAANRTNPDSITVIVPGTPDPKKFAQVTTTIPSTP
jgi:hypothetical protein